MKIFFSHFNSHEYEQNREINLFLLNSTAEIKHEILPEIFSIEEMNFQKNIPIYFL